MIICDEDREAQKIDCTCKLATLAMPRGPPPSSSKTARTPYTYIGIPYAPGILLEVLAMPMSVSKFGITELLSLSSMTNRHRHCVGWMSMGGQKSLMQNTDTQERGTRKSCGWPGSKETAVLGHVSHTLYFILKKLLRPVGGPPKSWASAVLGKMKISCRCGFRISHSKNSNKKEKKNNNK